MLRETALALDQTALSTFLVAIIGGGGAVPFIWRWWTRGHPRPVEERKTQAEIEAISTHAARETIEAMRGVMGVLRQQAHDDREENGTLREQQRKDREEIMRLRQKVEELVTEVQRLGGSVKGLEPGVA